MLCDTNIISVVGFRGVPGATPNLTATATTGPAYSEADVERTGPNTNPVFNFTIPRGDPGLNGTGVVVNTVAELRTAPNNGTATTLGCNAAGDQGGGFWRYDASSMATDNIGTVVRPTAVASNAPGRWIRQWSDMLDVRWFGAVCDGVTPSHVAVQAAIDAVPDYVGGEVFVPPNTAIGDTIVIGTNYVYTDTEGKKRVGGIPKSGIILRGSNGQGFGFTAAYAPPTLKWVGANGGTMIQINGALNITMRDMVISGNELTQALSRWVSGTTYALGALIIGESPSTTVYRSLQANNTNHAVTDPAWWEVTEYVPDEDGIIQLYPAAAYGLYFEGSTSGWGVSNYEYLVLTGFTKNAVHKTRYAPADVPLANRPGNDYGRNHWVRCTFKQTHKATGVAMDDAIYVYNYDSGVQDVFDHCEWIYKDSGVFVPGGHALWVQGGTPRIHLNDCYTIAYNGIFSNTTQATPKFQITQHYSEDNNFLRLPSAATRQVLNEVVHALDGGVSIEWAGGSGHPLIINGGYFAGQVRLTNATSPIIMGSDPYFVLGRPTAYNAQSNTTHFISNLSRVIEVGRSQGIATAGADSHAAINAAAFVPHAYTSITGNINPSLSTGTVCFHTLSLPTTIINEPVTIDPYGRDIGREIVLVITGHATSSHAVSFAAGSTYKLTGGRYKHSGPAKTDILAFMWDGTNWVETRRCVENNAGINAVGFVPNVATAATSGTVTPNVTNSSVFPVNLTTTTTIAIPTGVNATGLDVGREITLSITGHATNTYSVSFTTTGAGCFKLTGGRYTHSGPTKTDVLSFLWDGTNWVETRRSVEQNGAINANGFVPKLYANTGANINPSLTSGTINTHTLSQITTVNAPAGADPTLDIGREIVLKIAGHATTAHSVYSWNPVYKLAGGAYTHSGAGKTDILTFMYDGTYWWETSRAMNMTS